MNACAKSWKGIVERVQGVGLLGLIRLTRTECKGLRTESLGYLSCLGFVTKGRRGGVKHNEDPGLDKKYADPLPKGWT